MASHILAPRTAIKAVAIFEAKNRFSEMIAAVEHGEEITIARHGSPVARLVAISNKGQLPLAHARQIMDTLGQLPIEVDAGPAPGQRQLFELAMRYNLSSHDAAYLEFAY